MSFISLKDLKRAVIFLLTSVMLEQISQTLLESAYITNSTVVYIPWLPSNQPALGQENTPYRTISMLPFLLSSTIEIIAMLVEMGYIVSIRNTSSLSETTALWNSASHQHSLIVIKKSSISVTVVDHLMLV